MENAAGLFLFLGILVWVALVVGVGVFEGLYRCNIRLENYSMFKFRAADKNVVCPHCGGESFVDKQVLQNSLVATFIGMDWANRHATSLSCMDCGHIVWFAQKPDKIKNI